MDHIIIERVRYDNLTNINTCNYPKNPNDTDIIDLDYATEIKKTNLMNYAEIINYPIAWSYEFGTDEIKLLIDISSNYIKNGETNKINENINLIVDRLENVWPNTGQKYFFRFNSMSPKDGIPQFPVINAQQVIHKIVTSKRAWNCMMEEEKAIHFAEYDNKWDPRREFRVFIYKRKITAISQYNISIKNMLSGKSNIEAKQLVHNIQQYLENDILPKICDIIKTDNLVCDIYVNSDSTLRIVEFNSFGYWLAAGSALFEWLDDKNKLYNTDGKIFLKIIK